MHSNTENRHTNVSPNFTKCVPDLSFDLDLRNAGQVFGYSPLYTSSVQLSYFANKLVR